MSTTPLGARTRLVLTSLLLTSTLLLGACGGGDDPTTDPTPHTSSPTSGSTSDDPSASGSPSVAPAAGELVETKAFTANVPEGWQVTVVSKDFVITARPPHGFDLIAFELIPKNGAQPGLRALAKDAVEFGTWPGKDPAIVAPTELGGEPAYHLTGSGQGALVDARGAMHGTDAVSVHFEVGGSPAKLASVVDSVLATWQWK